MHIAALIARVLLGLVFLVFGLNGFLNFLPPGPLPEGPAGQFLGALIQSHYVYPVSALQLVGDHLWVLHHLAHIVPNNRIQLIGGNESGGAMLLPIGGNRRQFASASVVLVLRIGMTGASGAAQVASSAADQAAQQVRVPGVPTRELLIGGQALLRCVEHLRWDDGGHRHSDPLLTRCELDADTASDRLQRRTASLRRATLETPADRFADVCRIRQDGTHAGGRPELAAGGRCNSASAQAYRQSVQGRLAIGIGLEQFTYYSRRSFVDLDERGITWSFWMYAIAVRRNRPWQQATDPELGLPSPSHPVGDQRPFVLGNGTADLNNKLFVWIVGRRSVDEHHADAMPLELFKDDHLVDVVARQTVWCSDEHHVERSPCCLVTQSVQAWPLQLGAGVTVISEDVLLLDHPISAVRHIGAQQRDLLFDRLGLLLPLRRHSNVERCSHDHLLGLAELLLPNAGGVGTRDPIVAARPGRRLHRVLLASFCAPATSCAAFEFSTRGHTTATTDPGRTELPIPVGPVPPPEVQASWPRPAEFVICEQPIEEIFGWMKTVGGFRKTRYRGLERVNLAGYLVGAAYNLVRMGRLVMHPMAA